MRPLHRSDREDLDFFRKVAQTAFCNPFTAEFEELCREIDERAVPSRSDSATILADAVGTRMRALDADRLARLEDFSLGDRDVLRTVFLFHAYYQYYGAFDELILQQLESGDEPVPAAFGPEILRLLRQRGLPAEEARRALGIFYQIRRAHHFITRGLLGHSESMWQFRRRLWENVFTHDLHRYEQCLWDRMEDFATLLLGETGTGKGAAAAAIGRSAFIPFDERRGCFAASFTKTFIAINLSQFPEALIESELFGHRKGAFTGAADHHEGVFQRCSQHGAIFLDEIGDVSLHIQVKLLRVLEDRSFTPVGSRTAMPFRGRIIAATHRPLHQLRDEGKFRDDFYYRLCSDAITVPSLRDRVKEEPGELSTLVDHLLRKLTARDSKSTTQEVMAALRPLVATNYAWPGNVRELEQATRRILIATRYEPEVRMTTPPAADELSELIRSGRIDADRLLAKYCTLLYERSHNLEEVARQTALDRRTVKRYLEMAN